jgi:signal transduction histidine kinase
MATTASPPRGSRVLAALDWGPTPVAVDGDEGIIKGNEERLARMAGFIRALMVPFLAIPLFGWNQLEHPWLAVVALVTAAVEAGWVVRRCLTRGNIRGDELLAWVDVGFCVALMTIGSRAAVPELRNVIMTEVVPFSLVSALILGFTVGLRPRAIAGMLLMWVSWFLTLLPDIGLKLGSDLLGFVLWYVVGLFVSTLLRVMAGQTAQAVADRRRAEAERLAAERAAAEQKRLLDLARHRDRTRRSLHDGVLWILDGLARDDRLPADARRSARRGALKVRNLFGTARDAPSTFHARLTDLADTFVDLKLLVHPSFHIHADPPPHVAEIVLAAAGEALANALKHGGPDNEAVFFAECAPGALELSVLDRGPGFDPAGVSPGDGMAKTFRAVNDLAGGRCEVNSAPGEGVKVTITWKGPADDG